MDKITFMSWNTNLYTFGNEFDSNTPVKLIDDNVVSEIINYIKDFVDRDGIAILQEIPYKINTNYKDSYYDLKKWSIHPIYRMLCEKFQEKYYDFLYDNSICVRIKQTVVISKKNKIEKYNQGNMAGSNIFIPFKIKGISNLVCLGVHAHNAFELREWLSKNDFSPAIIAGDFNSGNYILESDDINRKTAVNRQNYLLLLDGYIDLVQGKITTNYPNVKEQRQIDHVLLKNSTHVNETYEYKNVNVDYHCKKSDHYPVRWSLLYKK